ncbi:MAG: DUF1559 domain-containing protein [Planctomycetales bacterium]|nr:DUF1559 domain-containing protein [Planctomycetales bacterium]
MSIISLLVSLLLPAVQMARETARRISCANHLHQLSLAIQLHADTFRMLPGNGGFTPDSTIDSTSGAPTIITTTDTLYGTFHQWGIGRPGAAPATQPGAWSFAILPYLEQKAAYDRLAIAERQPMYLCPSRSRPDPLPTVNDAFGQYESAGWAWARTDYCANSKIATNYPEVKRVAFITDGLSQTLMLGEKAFDFTVHVPTSWYWDEPIFSGGSKGTARSGLTIVPDGRDIAFKDNWGSAHPGGAMFSRADGSTQFVTGTITFPVLRALLTPNGSDVEAIDAP